MGVYRREDLPEDRLRRIILKELKAVFTELRENLPVFDNVQDGSFFADELRCLNEPQGVCLAVSTRRQDYFRQ